MSPEAQRIAIAEACGWTAIQNCGGAGGFIAKMPDGTTLWDNCLGATAVDAIDANCPAYLDDLNAMHEAEKVLNGPVERGRYFHFLDEVSQGFPRCAPATQRAEAFLRAINKWTESPLPPPPRD